LVEVTLSAATATTADSLCCASCCCPNTDKPRGYAFIEYEHKKDMKEAYKLSDGRKIEGRRILVDVERGRTVENW
jgi:RNA recognition motif-containing protein